MRRILFMVLVSQMLIGISISASAQSIADAARKERERQKQIHGSTTIKGVPTTTAVGTASTSAAPAPATAASATTTPVGVTDNKGHDEKYWRGLFQKARDDVKHADDKIVLLDAKVKELNTALLRQSDIYNRENRLGPEIAKTQMELDDARMQAVQARQKLVDLEDDLRKAGGPAGWAR
jgi:hypothetical protein